VDGGLPELYQSADECSMGFRGSAPGQLVARFLSEATMTGRAARILAVLRATAMGAAPAAADFSMQHDAFVRGFNNFARANGKPLRLTLKVTDTSRMGKFVYDLRGCATVTGLSKETNQIIDTLVVTATACTQPGKVDDFVLLAKYLASLTLQGPSLRTADDTIAQSFKIADKTHKKHTITVGQFKIEIEFSDVIGWVMRAQ
jgi:hypothetical protein